MLSCGLKPWSPAKLRLFILSFCRSVKESIKESASKRRQELPAGTEAAPLCQPLKCGADYRDVTAALKMKHLRRLCGERRTFLGVAASFRRRRRREQGLDARYPCRRVEKLQHNCTISIAAWGVYPMKKSFQNVRRDTLVFSLSFISKK